MSYEVIVTTPKWYLSGVNTFVAALARGLARRGVRTTILLTRERPSELPEVARPRELHFERLVTGGDDSWPGRWHALGELLTARAPCVYLPNYDFDLGIAAAWLPPQVKTVAVLHSDEAAYYRFLARLHPRFDAVVAVSMAIEARARRIAPGAASRIHRIPYGIAPHGPVARAPHAGPLRIAFVGRLYDHQKRVRDLPRIGAALLARGVDLRLTVLGDGPERAELETALAAALGQSRVTMMGALAAHEVEVVLAATDVLLLPSNYEGLPLTLLEAMSQGVVPVVSDIASGVPELVEHERNGFRVPVGDVASFAEALATLASDRGRLAAMSEAARATFTAGPYTEDAMVERYAELFERTLGRPSPRRRRWPRRLPPLPPYIHTGGSLQLPYAAYRALRRIGAFGRALRSRLQQ